MDSTRPPPAPELWLRQIFSSKAARDGGIVRRQVRDVDRILGREPFEAELRRRGFRAVENAGQYVIFCNRAPVRPIIWENPSKDLPRSLPRPLRKVFENLSLRSSCQR